MSRHLNTPKDKISPYILISGNPERTEWAAKQFLTNPERVNDNRLAYVYTGMYKGVRVSLATSGMGMPTMNIYVTELIRDYGAKVIIRTGTAGNLNPDFKVCELAVINAAHMRPDFERTQWITEAVSYPDADVLQTMVDEAKKMNQKAHQISIHTSNNFYEDLEKIHEYTNNGVIPLVDMESAALFSIGNVLKCKTGAIMMISDNIGFASDEDTSFEDRVKKTEKMFALGLETLVTLSKKK